MQYFTQYNQPNSRKKQQMDNVDIMNAFRKTMFLQSYSFMLNNQFNSTQFIHNISDFNVSIFRNMCLKIAHFHNLSKNRQIHVIKRCQLMDFDAFIL